MKFMVSILLGLNLLVQGTVLPASSCFIPNVTIPLSPAAQTDTAPAADLNISAPSAILMEASTGAVVYEKNSHEARHPASVTKIMTLLLIFDALSSKQISLDDTVTVSEYAASMGGSQVFLEPGETQTVETMIKCMTLATSIEGHPDNVAPALLGGLTSSVFEDGVVYSVKRDVDESLCFAAIVPDYKLLTEAARAALPKEVTHKDAVYNLSRAALIPAAFCEGRHDLLAIATEDKLHQPYRMPLMPGSKEVFDMARLCGAKAVYVSGAGSTVMAVAEKANAEKFYSKLEKGLELLEGLDGCEAFTLLRLDADNTGATVE